MQRALSSIVLIAWAVWFGGTLMLFTAVSSLFKTFADDHATAGLAARGIFHRFNTLELLVGTALLLSTFAWRITAPRPPARVLPILLVLAWIALLFSAVWLTPRIEAIRLENVAQPQALASNVDFKRLHGVSMAFYAAQALFLLCAGIVLSPGSRRY